MKRCAVCILVLMVTIALWSPAQVLPSDADSDGDGIPDTWETEHGLDPQDASDANLDPDHDGWSNLQEYLNGTDPNHPDTLPNIIVNDDKPFTTSRTITIQPSSTDLPNIRIRLDPFTTDAVVLSNTGRPILYSLPDADGSYDLFLQYADTEGHPHSPPAFKTVTLRRRPPVVYITSPASNAVLDQAFIDLRAVAAASDPFLPLKIWINGERFWDRMGTNIIIDRFPVPTGTNLFSVDIVVEDEAGNSNEVVRTWTVDSSHDTTAPQLSSFNIDAEMMLPDVNELWIEAVTDDENAIVNAIVSSDISEGTTNSLHVHKRAVEGLVPLEFGTNRVVLLATDRAGNASSNVFKVIRTNRYRFEITSPAFGTFATAPRTLVSGYVSAKIDEGLPTERKVSGVLINNVQAVLDWDHLDANDNVPFRTTNTIPLGVPIIGQVVGEGDPPGTGFRPIRR